MEVLILATYCDDNKNCTDRLPCEDCLKMCNVAIIKSTDKHKIQATVIGGYDYLRDQITK